MINKLIDATPGNETTKLLEEAEKFFKDQKYDEAQKIYENLIAIDSSNIKVITGLLRCLIQLEKFKDVREILESLDDKVLENSEINKIKKLVESLNTDQNPSSIHELENQMIQNPKDKSIRFELSTQLLQSNQIEKGFNELLKLFDQDPKWNDEAAKKKLLEYFDFLGFNDPNVIEARKKLSSMMFK